MEKKNFGKGLFAYKIRFALEKKRDFCVIYENCMGSIFFQKKIKIFCHQSVQLFSKSHRNGLIFFLLFFGNV